LRIEDTDQSRSSVESERKILESLQWLGLTWDEGPDVGGANGPYRQSQRSQLYREHIDKLLEKGHAFHCFCSPERLKELRAEQIKNKQTAGYDGCCLTLTEHDVNARLKDGVASVIRMKIPTTGDCTFSDGLRGEIRIPWSQVDMQVLIKSDGLPTYHFANVVDDYLMQISHVIRGEEWINSTPKHLLLYNYFGWEVPGFYHMPLLRNPDKSKLSKRKNPTSILYYRDLGYLPQAVVNYLGTMGWTLPSGEEKFSLQQMTEEFDLQRVSLGGPIFDLAKLDWLNGKYLREDLDDQQFLQQYLAWATASTDVSALVPLVKQRIEKFSEVADLAAFMFNEKVQLESEMFAHKSLQPEMAIKVLQYCLWRLEEVGNWDRESVEQVLLRLGEQMGLKIREFLFPVFLAVSGKPVSVSVIDAIAILGIDRVRARLRHALEVLGGVSKKQLKQFERDYRALDPAND